MDMKECVDHIITRSSVHPDDAAELVKQIALETRLTEEILFRLVAQHGGWMALTMFTVGFLACKDILAAAEGKDREVIKTMVENIIGSFGRSVQ